MKKILAVLALFSFLGLGALSAEEAPAPKPSVYPASPSEARNAAHFAEDYRIIQTKKQELADAEARLRSDYESFLQDGAKLHGIPLKPGEKAFYDGTTSKEAPNGFFYAFTPKEGPPTAVSETAPVVSKP